MTYPTHFEKIKSRRPNLNLNFSLNLLLSDLSGESIKVSMAIGQITKEGNVYLLPRITKNRIPFRKILLVLVVMTQLLSPLWVSAVEDPCREAGIYIGNQTGIDVWYNRNGGACTIWNHGHLLIIKPEEVLTIYRDMICNTEYCPKNPAYDDYKSLDANQNCRVRILPDCNLSDM